MNAKGNMLRSRYTTPQRNKVRLQYIQTTKYYVGKFTKHSNIYSSQYDCIGIEMYATTHTDINTNEQWWLKDVMVVNGDRKKGNAKGYHALLQPQTLTEKKKKICENWMIL